MVLYEDPPDAIPKIHIRSKKYMAWIAENNLPVHMHVEKVKMEGQKYVRTLSGSFFTPIPYFFPRNDLFRPKEW